MDSLGGSNNKDLILVVEDNEAIQYNISLILKLNDYDVLTALNGVEAIKILRNAIKKPDLILSDVLMPEMNGYELLQAISQNSEWDMIPFIFLSAKASSDEIKQGKLLGADDYITKPIDEELLLGLIKKKINKVRQLEFNLKNKLEINIFNGFQKQLGKTRVNFEKSAICLFIVQWDENLGPIVTNKYIDTSVLNFDLESLGIQLFQTTISLFGQEGVISPEAVLLNVKNINMKSMILFDSIQDNSIRGNQKQFMVSVIAPEITYLDSLNLKNTLLEISSKIKIENEQDFSWYFEEIQSMLIKS